MAKNIYNSNKTTSGRPRQSKRNLKKKNITRSIIKAIKKDPIKILAVFLGGILLIIITILFILYSKDTASNKVNPQKIESR